MAIDLQNPTNIGTGWGPPPQFHAPEIGGLVGHILQNRLLQKAQQDKEIAQAVKAMQEQRQGNVYGQAARDAGLLPGVGDISGLSASEISNLASRIMENTPDTDLDALRQAQAAHLGAATNKENTIADYIKQYGTTPGRGGGAGVGSLLDENGVERAVGETWIGSDGKERIMTFNRGPKLTAVGLQPSDQRTQNENQMLKEQAGLLEQKGQMESEIQSQRDANIQLGAQTKDPKYQNVPYKRSDEYNRTVNRLKQLQQSKVIPSTQPPATPQASPAETGDTSDIMKGTDQLNPDARARIQAAGGADKNLAKGYGNDATSMSADDVRKAYRNGQMNIDEAKARLKQLGFGD